jgi:hypothetical protein
MLLVFHRSYIYLSFIYCFDSKSIYTHKYYFLPSELVLHIIFLEMNSLGFT